jgi:flagellar assembly protein FliH
MMILPSESVSESDGLTVRTVGPLEFEELTELSGEGTLDNVKEEPRIESENQGAYVLAELEARLHSQAKRSEEQIAAAREDGRTELREELVRELEEKLVLERESVTRMCDLFSRERNRYFIQVEAEIVRLALAIAARVLHREVAIDPLLLQGVVKVALEKVQESGAAVLRVPEEQAEEWGRILSDTNKNEVTIVGDSRLRAGECVFETSVGRVDLGVEAQLEEIEKGFFDLLQQRPA